MTDFGESLPIHPALSLLTKQARAVQPSWNALGFKWRKRVVSRMARIITGYADQIAACITSCTGKNIVDALITEVVPSAMSASWYARRARKFLKRRRIRAGNILFSFKRSYLLREPWGVIGIISPWNYPWSIPFQEIASALMAGNAVILKMASMVTPLVYWMKRVSLDAGVPKHVLQFVELPGEEAGPAFLSSGVDKLFFTGSTIVGKKLMHLASRSLTPLCLELGGNNAMVVLENANLDRAANGALWAGLTGCGQSCGSVQRILVHRNVVVNFSSIISDKLARLRLGAETGFDLDIGRLATRRQYETVSQHLSDALDKGAHIVAQIGPDDPDKCIHPAVILDRVTDNMKIMKEETFGPLMVIDTFNTTDEAIQKANSTSYGLAASVWSKDTGVAKKIATRLCAGSVMINDHLMNHGLPETHWGGSKLSGTGRTHGEAGFFEMTQTRVIVDDLLHPLPRAMWWYPYS
ncbi:MAG: aldehyde dehydrogenase family protein, partial [Spirochaetaceae bacterium]